MPTRRLALPALLCLLLAPAALAQPFTVTATSGPAPAPEGHIRVAWTPTDTPGELYVIRRILYVFGQPPVDQGVVAVRPETDSTYLDANTRPGTTYEYCITPQTSGTPEACASGYRDLRRPSNLQATDSTRTDGVAMTWVDLSSVEVGYVVFRDAPGTPAGNPGALTPIDTTTADATGYLDNTGVPGQRYQYCVGLLDGFGGVQTVIPPLACDVGTRGVVAPPSGVAASDGTLDDRVRVVWTARPNVSYSVYRNIAGQPRGLLASGLTTSPYEDLTAVSLQPYTYCVTATNAQGESVAVCDAGQRGGLSRPDSLVVSYDTSDSAVELSWNDPGPTETGFRIYRQPALPIGGPEEFVAEVPANRTRYSDTDAVPGRTYDFSIEAIATVTVGGVPVTTVSQRRYGLNVGRRAPLLPPTDFTASDAATGEEAHVELAWETESDVVQLFQVFRDGTPLATLPPFARGYRDETGLAGTTYPYHVRAVSVVDLDPALVKQGLAPIFARAAASRAALEAEREDARESDPAALARLATRAETQEADLVREIQDLLTGMGADASGLSGSASLTGTLVSRDSDPDDGGRLVRAPGGLAATTDLEDRIRLTWTDRSSIETFHQIQADYGTVGETYTIGPNQTEWVDIAAPAGIDVQYQIRTLDGDESSVASFSEWVPITGRREILPPGRVTAAQDLVETELVVAWRDSSRAEDGYRVLANLSTGWWIGEAPANTRQLVVPIQPEDFGTNIPVKVMAFSDEDRSFVPLDPTVEPTYTGSAQVEVTAMPRLLPPTVVTASTEYPNQVVVSWTDESAANDGYRVVRLGAVPDTLAATGTTAIDASPAGPASYCVIPTRSGAPEAEPAGVCATGRVSSSTAPGTGDVVTTATRIGGLDVISGTDGFGAQMAGDGGYVIASAADDARQFKTGPFSFGAPSGTVPDWALPVNPSYNTIGGQLIGPPGTPVTLYNQPDPNYDQNRPGIGNVAFYTRTAEGAWANVTNIQLSPTDAFTYNRFGEDVDVKGEIALIGAPGPATFTTHPRTFVPQNPNQVMSSITYGDGGAYIYRRNGGDGTWSRAAALRPFGWQSNSFTNETARTRATSWQGDEFLGVSQAVYRRWNPYGPYPDGNYVLQLDAIDTDSRALNVERMGELVALSDTWAFSSFVWLTRPPPGPQHVIGVYRASGAYEYRGAFNTPDGFDSATGSLAADGDLVVVGSVAGHVNISRMSESGGVSETFALETLVSPSPGPSAEFGAAVDVDTDGDLTAEGQLVVVGAPGAGDNAVYVFRRTSGFTWVQEARLTPEPGDTRFGTSVTIGDGFIAIGAEEAGAPGVAYTFRKEGLNWVRASRLTPEAAPGVGPDAAFGASVSAFEDDLIIGAPGTVADGVRQGSLYFATVSVSPTNVAASDGRYANRVLVRWEDQSGVEDGYRVYRRGPTDDDFALVGTLDPNAEVFDDFDVSPGDVYQYCIASFLGDDVSNTNPLGESGRSCDAGYTPPNGTISGRLATGEGAPVIGTGVCLAPGLDQAVMFDGLGGRGVVSSFGSLPTAFTMEAWIHADTYDDGANPVVGVDGASFAMLEVVGASGAGTPRLRVQNDGDPSATVLDGPALAPGWHHLAATHDGSTLAFYVDGQPAGTAAFADTTRARGTFQMAADLAGNAFDGRLDDIRLWSRAFTPAQIAAAYDEARPLEGDEPDLYAYWAIDQGLGRILTDLTAGGRHATLQGGAEWTRQGAPLNTCAASDGQGNYTFAGLRYGDATTFTVTPTDSTRQFTPGARTATLTPASPTENQMDFTDTSTFTVRGRVVHAADQTLWPGQDDLSAPEIEILVDGAVAATSESDGTFAVAVRGSGQHVIEARSETFPGLSFRAEFADTTYSDGTAELAVTRDLDGLRFINTASRELRGRAAGGCDRAIGDLTFRIYTEDRRFDRTFQTGDSAPYALLLPPVEYRLEFEDVDDIPSTLDRAEVVRYFRNLGVLEADLTTEADTVDFRYRAPIVLAIGGLPAPTCTQTAYTVVDAAGNNRQSIPVVPVIGEYARTPLLIEAYEDYGDGGLCPVDEGTVHIFDGFADAPEPIAVELENGEAEYTTFGRSPDTFSGRTVGGVDRSYQKSLTAVLEVPDGPSVTETVWAVVEGYREKPATFVTATMSEIPLMILRDPPGSESSAFMEEESQSCSSISEVNSTSTAGGASVEFRLGFKAGIGFFVTQESGAAVHFKAETLLGIGTTSTTGGPESNMRVCATSAERWETRGDTGWSGEDLFTGVGLNVLFAEADVVDVNACQVQLSTTLATDFDSSDPFGTTYVYGKTHIEETLIPQLEELAALAGEGTVIEDPEPSGEAPAFVTIRKSITNWEDMLVYNDSLVTAALEGEVDNRSFSGGTTYSYGTSADTTWTSSFAMDVFFSSDIRLGPIFTIAGYSNIIDSILQIKTESTFAQEQTTTNSYGMGYTLSDSDAGDYFSVDVAQDPRYGTYVFNTVSGASSNPWEPNTQKRDNPLLDIDPPVRDGIPEGQAALFTLQLTNASESGERREYVLDVPPHLNRDGTAVKLNGAILSEKRVLIDPGTTISFPITVERGPEADTSDVAIIAYSPFDHAIWRTAPQLGLATADTARFQVRFVSDVAPVTLLEPEDGWAVTQDDDEQGADSLRLTLADIHVAPLASEQLGVEVRQPGGEWENVFTVTGDELTGSTHSVWWTFPGVDDGPYELRAFAQRSGSTAPRYNGPTIPGLIDRTRPLVFGLPQPADGLLSLGETIGLTFEEPIDCARLRQEHQSGISGPLAELVASSGPIQTDIGCVDNALVLAPNDVSAWLAVEGQLVTARIKGVRDLAGNLMQPLNPSGDWSATWGFTVRRNAFGWTPAVVAVNAQPDVPADLPAALVNGRPQPVAYEFIDQGLDATGGLPFTFTETTTGDEVHVTTSPLSGTIVSGDVQPVVFRWPGAPVGTYTSNIEVEGTEAGQTLPRTPLTMTVQVSCAAPIWVVNPAAYETSMTITADLQMPEGVSSTDPADRLAAFVDGEIRGVDSLNTATGRFGLTIYGPGPAEAVTFQAWDASECALHTSTSRVIEFAAGTTRGTVGDPFVIIAPGVDGPALEVPLNEGWTWISTNREGNETLAQALVGVGSAPTDQIKSPDQNAFSQYVPGTGWAGDVAGMDLGEGYLIFLDQPATMRHPGALANPTLPIPLVMGWNWVGYLPQDPLPVDSALVSITAEPGDQIKSQQEGYAQYSETAGWQGSLLEMTPGQGYQMHVQDDHVLTYPEPEPLVLAGNATKSRPVRRMDRVPVYVEMPALSALASTGRAARPVANRGHRAAPTRAASRSRAVSYRSGHFARKGGSTLVGGYEHSMTLTATLDAGQEDLWIAAFAPDGDGETLRGLAPVRLVEALGGPRAYLLIGGTGAPETVTLRAGTVGTDGVFVPLEGEVSFPTGVPESGSTDPATAVFAYQRDAAWGTPDLPVELSTQIVTAGEGQATPSVVELAAVRPNPFAASAVFEFALPSASPVRLSVYDMLGREVAVLAEGDRAAGRHEVRFDGRALAAGTYVARLVAGDEARARTFIVTR